MKKSYKKLSWCPCNNDCCDNPKTQDVEHECTKGAFCEECYHVECSTCGDVHRCDL